MAKEQREVRACAKCGLEDHHTHHVQYVAFMHPVTGEGVDLSVSKHTQCCAEDGCEICSTDMEFAPVREIGDAFTEHMQTPKKREHLQALFERHSVESPDFIFGDVREKNG